MKNPLETFLSYLVALVFTIVAGFFAWFLGSTFSLHYAARSWVAVPAEVLSYDLHTSSSHRGTSLMPIMMERLVVTYAYEYGGARYTGDRLDFSFGSDNFSDSRHNSQMEKLRKGRVTIYVDPANPRDSVFDRSLPGGQVVFALVFLLFPCGVGTLVSIGLLLAALGRLGLPGINRFSMPLIGLFHSLPALYPAIFAPESVGLGGWLILLAFLGLLAVCLSSIWRRVLDPSIGLPKWSEHLNDRFSHRNGGVEG